MQHLHVDSSCTRALSDDRFSWTITKDMGFSSVNREIGPHDVNHDSWQMLNWSVLSMAGFVTYPDHAADGLATFVHVRSGAKMWTVYAPCKMDMGREDWLEYQKGIMSSGDRDFTYLDHADGYNIMVTDGGCL